MAEPVIRDDEVVLRRIPPTEPWVERGRMTTANFKLGRNELGLSVYRAAVVSAEAVLQRSDAIPGSRLVAATAGEIRALADATGRSLQLDIVRVDDEENPGHAEIRGPQPARLARAASKALRDVFRPVGDEDVASSTAES